MSIILAISMLPGLVLMLYIFKKDRLEKEPRALLLKLLILGAVFAFIPAILEKIGDRLIERYRHSDAKLYYILDSFLVVALSEEGFKHAVLRRNTWNNPNFNCSFDAIVYAAYISLGFAMLENFLYVFTLSISVGITRALTAIPAHFFNSVFMGVYYGRAKECQLRDDGAGQRRNMRLSLIVPLLLHGFYDTFVFLGQNVLFIVFLAGLYIFSFRTVIRESAEDRYLTGTF